MVVTKTITLITRNKKSRMSRENMKNMNKNKQMNKKALRICLAAMAKRK
jgi:hypothetical protein